MLALPHELDHEQRAQLAQDFALELVKRYKVAADVCIHKPAKQGDERNHHAHILITTRSVSISEDGIPILGDKTALEWSDRKRQEKGLNKAADEMKELREKWAELANKALESAGKTERIDPRSNEAQGIEKIPEEHLGHKITALERKGIKTTIGNRNRETRKKNERIKSCSEIDKKASLEAKKQRARLAAAHDKISEAVKGMVKEQEQKARPPQETKSQEPPKASLVKFATLWALSFVSQSAKEALDMLKAQLEEAKRAEDQRAKLEKEAQEKTAKVMQNLAAKKQAQKAEIDAIEQKIKARNERGRSRRQSIENAKRRIASHQAELEKQIAEELETQKEELEKQLAHMDRIYEESHSAIARQLLAKIVAR